jgi:hypothetical protein
VASESGSKVVKNVLSVSCACFQSAMVVWQVGVDRGREDFEQGSSTVEDLGVNAMEVLKVGDVADDPDLVVIQKHDFARTFIGICEIRLTVELIGVGDAWSQIRR